MLCDQENEQFIFGQVLYEIFLFGAVARLNFLVI
jgi:hypothetical protein